MRIPVTLYRFASGTGPGDPDELEHGVFTTERAAFNVLRPAIEEAHNGRLRVTPGARIYVYAFADTIESESPATALAEGYELDYARLMPVPVVEPPPVAELAIESVAAPPDATELLP